MMECNCKGWDILAGEYPPEHGGVSDYTQRVAQGLAAKGQQVRVWARGNTIEPTFEQDRLWIHRCAGDFSNESLKKLNLQLNQIEGRKRILLQYVPYAFGCRSMNVALPAFMRNRARHQKDEIRVMFHEVAYPFVWRPIRHNLLAAVHAWMAKSLVSSASIIYVSTTAWIPKLRRLGAQENKIILLPIPSNVPELPAGVDRATLRNELLKGGVGTRVVGHFGNYGANILQLLEPTLLQLFFASDVHVHLIGNGSEKYRDYIVRNGRADPGRVSASGRLEASEIAKHIAVCDVMLQPYLDGANTRRTTLMACLLNKVATVSNDGHNCEEIWRNGKPVFLSQPAPHELAAAIERLLANDQERRNIASNGYDLYHDKLSLSISLKNLSTTQKQEDTRS